MASRHKGEPLYEAWHSMRTRCHNPNTHYYKNYGGRGIKVCARWDQWCNFALDMGPHPGKDWSLDRINPNGDYEPSNCRWATRKTQQRNRRRNKLSLRAAIKIIAMYKRGSKTQQEIAAKYGVDQKMISNVVRGRMWK